MDIDKTSFYTILPDILNDVGESYFVAIDLELSGVPVKERQANGQSHGKQTLQQRYAQVKAAAEKYQIIQIGLTIVQQDENPGQYMCKPLNIPISPLTLEHGVDIERDVVFSSGAASFLRSVAFDFSRPFNDGLPYITDRERTLAKEAFQARQQRIRKDKIDVKASDVEALALLDDARQKIKKWLSSTAKDKEDYLNIGPSALTRPIETYDPNTEMTKYQKWLIHQLVEVEYPRLKSIGKRGFIQITLLDQTVEAAYELKKEAEFDLRLARQKGFGWLFDALLGKALCAETLAKLNHEACMEEEDTAKEKTMQQLKELVEYLQECPAIIVGHNCFLDLVYLYHNFVGALPDTVEAFATSLHSAFPLVIDTKYMATHNCGDIPPQSSLEDLVRRLEPKNDEERLDYVAEAFDKYEENESFHEAGFDSLMTAQVAIRLSRQLELAGTYIDEAEEGGVSLTTSTAGKPRGSVSTVIDKSIGALSTTLESIGLKSKSKEAETSGDSSEKDSASQGMPDFSSDFWRVYGNHLRVFGTEEGVLTLQ